MLRSYSENLTMVGRINFEMYSMGMLIVEQVPTIVLPVKFLCVCSYVRERERGRCDNTLD